MSDIFAALSGGIRFPDARINGGGPLPTSLSGPAGINGDPDGLYNFNGELLPGITPYAFGPGRMGSDRNYQQIPHRIQKIIPPVFLPYAEKLHNDSMMKVSHGIDQGDIAFAINSEQVQSMLFDSVCMRDAKIYQMKIPNSTAFVNLATVNYILAGLQRFTASDTHKTCTWASMAVHLGFDWKHHNLPGLMRLVSTRLLPFGICAGSEKQGGQNETGLAPVQAAANHVTTMTVDGQNRDLVNLWSHLDLSAGDTLILRLKFMPTQNYTLNHYYKGVVRQTFPHNKPCWQLVADKFEMQSEPQTDVPEAYDYRVNGYWRVRQLFQHWGKTEQDAGGHANNTMHLRGQLLQVTFAPVWTCLGGIRRHTPTSAPGSLLNASGASAAKRPRIQPTDGMSMWHHAKAHQRAEEPRLGPWIATPSAHEQSEGGASRSWVSRSNRSRPTAGTEGTAFAKQHSYNVSAREPQTVPAYGAGDSLLSAISGKVSFSHGMSIKAATDTTTTPAATETHTDAAADRTVPDGGSKAKPKTTRLKVKKSDAAADVIVSVIETLPESK